MPASGTARGVRLATLFRRAASSARPRVKEPRSRPGSEWETVLNLRAAIVNVVIAALPILVLTAAFVAMWGSPDAAIDFRSVTPAIRGLAHGTDPYVVEGLARGGHFLWTVLCGWLLAPLAWMPGGWLLAIALQIVGLVSALWLLEVRDWRAYALALAWPATVNSVQTANITILVAVFVAAGWRTRGSPFCGLWLGLAVAVKLFAWPVLVWLAATRRWRALIAATTVQVIGLLATVPYISIVRFARYEREVDRVLSGQAITLKAMLLDQGVWGAQAITLAVGLTILWFGRRDLAWCVVSALVLSPIVWLHYFDLLLFPLALWSAPFWAWTIPFGLWVAPGEGNGAPWQTATSLGVAAATVAVSWRWRNGERVRRLPQSSL